ncbi:MAG TPA: CDP-diacylglycerol--glycerol-3-phosphate 3-phosphatidyltransferase [Clostridiaceae bacterium]|nr:CDP-diacylglycerol--glycerol-3-phosphate 3-phosphatidyltransferase [Clostridiaceae bacterium]
MSIPNILTVIRFILIPVFGYYLFHEQYKVALLLFLLAGLTDVLDGYIARAFNMVTPWGKLADPLADKLMQITALVLLTYLRKIPIIIVIIVGIKELFMGLGSIVLYKKRQYVVSANWYGKLATVIFYFAVVMIIMFDMSKFYNYLFIGIAVFSTLFAFFMYLNSYRKISRNRQV